jgi:hypothetical protein
MQRPTTFSKRLGSMMLAGYGIAASAAHADPGSSAAVSSTAAVSPSSTQSEAQRQCAASTGAASTGAASTDEKSTKSNDAGALARFETGTTFMLTENGLIVLKRPAPKKWYSAVKSDESENLNTGG